MKLSLLTSKNENKQFATLQKDLEVQSQVVKQGEEVLAELRLLVTSTEKKLDKKVRPINYIIVLNPLIIIF